VLEHLGADAAREPCVGADLDEAGPLKHLADPGLWSATRP
jgi:hypothetical protein